MLKSVVMKGVPGVLRSCKVLLVTLAPKCNTKNQAQMTFWWRCCNRGVASGWVFVVWHSPNKCIIALVVGSGGPELGLLCLCWFFSFCAKKKNQNCDLWCKTRERHRDIHLGPYYTKCPGPQRECVPQGTLVLEKGLQMLVRPLL